MRRSMAGVMVLVVGLPGTVWGQHDDVLAAITGVPRPPGLRFRAQVVLTLEDGAPVCLLAVGHVGDGGQWRVDLDWRMAERGKSDIFRYREGMAYSWHDGTLLAVRSALTRNPISVAPAEVGEVDTVMRNSIGSGTMPQLGVYLRGCEVLGDPAWWVVSVEPTGDEGPVDELAVIRKARHPIKPLEPHAVVEYRYYVAGDMRVVRAEGRGVDGQVVLTTQYSEHVRLASGHEVPLRSSTRIVPGEVGARGTVTSSWNGEPPQTDTVIEGLPWDRCRIERQMQVLEGKHVVPRRTTVYAEDGRVLDDIDYMFVEVCTVPASRSSVDLGERAP